MKNKIKVWFSWPFQWVIGKWNSRNFFCPMTTAVCSVKYTFGGKILGFDPNLIFCVLIILLKKFHTCALNEVKNHIQVSLLFDILLNVCPESRLLIFARRFFQKDHNLKVKFKNDHDQAKTLSHFDFFMWDFGLVFQFFSWYKAIIIRDYIVIISYSERGYQSCF